MSGKPWWIERGKTRRGGYRRAQLALLGVPWPPPRRWLKNWLKTVDDADVPAETKLEFIRLGFVTPERSPRS